MTGDTDRHAAPGGDEIYSPASRRPTVAVIVPAYNEQDAVRSTVEHVRRTLTAAILDRDGMYPPAGFDADKWRAYRHVFATHVVED